MTTSTDDRELEWIGISGYLPPCIDGAWEDGAVMGDTPETLKAICIFLKGWLNRTHEGEGSAGSPFESWLEGEEIGDVRDGHLRLLRWNQRCKSPLSDEDVLEVAHNVDVGDRSKFTCKLAMRCPSLAEYCEPEICRLLANRALKLEDFGETYYDKKAKSEKFVFNRHMAAMAILDKMALAMTPSKELIYNFDGEIYRPFGAEAIKDTVYSICEDGVNRGNLGEVLDRVGARLKLNTIDLKPEPYLMPLQNGVLDLKAGELLEYSPDHKFTFKYGARWDPEGGDWRRVLWHLCSSLKDPRDVLQAIDVMTATALRIPFDSWLLLIGSGQNGKGMFERLLLNFVTQDRASAMTLDEMKRSKFGAGYLLDVDLLLVSEVETVRDANSVLKKLATGEFMDSDVKYGGRAKGSPHLMTVLDANNAFEYGDDSFGRKRRTLKLDWPYVFGDGPDDRPIDRTIEELFKSDEILSGVAWIIAARAPSLIQTRKIYRYKTAEELDEEFDRQRNHLHYFTEECLGERSEEWLGEFGELGEANIKRLTTARAHELYLEWCNYFNVPSPASAKALTAYIKKKFNTDTKKSHATGPGDKDISYRYFEFVGLTKLPGEVFSDYKLSHYSSSGADNNSSGALMGQIESSNIDISEYNGALGALGADRIKIIISEIEEMYSFISSCKSPREISWKNYLNFSAPCAPSAPRHPPITFSVGHLEKSSAPKEDPDRPNSISETNAEAKEREKEWLDHTKTPETEMRTFLALQDVPTFSDGNGGSWTLKKGDLVGGLPVMLSDPLLRRGALREVIS